MYTRNYQSFPENIMVGFIFNIVWQPVWAFSPIIWLVSTCPTHVGMQLLYYFGERKASPCHLWESQWYFECLGYLYRTDTSRWMSKTQPQHGVYYIPARHVFKPQQWVFHPLMVIYIYFKNVLLLLTHPIPLRIYNFNYNHLLDLPLT